MATFTLTTPVHVGGDLLGGVTVSQVVLVSFSMNFQGASPVFSIMLQDMASGFIHTVTLTGAEGAAALAALRGTFPTLEAAILQYIVSQGKLPPGTIS